MKIEIGSFAIPLNDPAFRGQVKATIPQSAKIVNVTPSPEGNASVHFVAEPGSILVERYFAFLPTGTMTEMVGKNFEYCASMLMFHLFELIPAEGLILG